MSSLIPGTEGLYNMAMNNQQNQPPQKPFEFTLHISTQEELAQQAAQEQGQQAPQQQPVQFGGQYIQQVPYCQPNQNTMHPNAPEIWEDVGQMIMNQMAYNASRAYEEAKARASRYYRRVDIPLSPYEQQLRQQQAAQRIQQRGYYSYSGLNDPTARSHRWNTEFKNDIEKQVNDPSKFGERYCYPEHFEDRYDKVTGVNIDEQDEDNNYYAITEKSKDLAEEIKNKADSKIATNEDVVDKATRLAVKNKEYRHAARKAKSREGKKVTPPIPKKIIEEPDEILMSDYSDIQEISKDITQSDKDQIEQDWNNSCSSKGFKMRTNPAPVPPVADINASDQEVADSLLNGDEPPVYTPEQEAAMNYVRKVDFPTYFDPHAGMNIPYNVLQQPRRMPWEYAQVPYNPLSYNGCPSPKSLMQLFSKEELESGKFPVVLNEITKDLKFKEPPKKNYGHIDDPKHPVLCYCTKFHFDKDGDKVYDQMMNEETEEWMNDEELAEYNKKLKALKHKSVKVLMEEDKINQIKTDDTYRVALELNRYSTEAAALLMWIKFNVDKNTFNAIKASMIEDLKMYRALDPFATLKSFVYTSKGKMIVSAPMNQDITMEDIEAMRDTDCDRVTKYLNDEQEMEYRKAEIMAFKNANCIVKGDLKKTLQNFMNLADATTMPMKAERWRLIKNEILKSLTPIKKAMWDEYNGWIIRSIHQWGFGLDNIVKFGKWWNAPYEKIEAKNKFMEENSWIQKLKANDGNFNYFMDLLYGSRHEQEMQRQQAQANMQNQARQAFKSKYQKMLDDCGNDMQKFAKVSRMIDADIQRSKMPANSVGYMPYAGGKYNGIMNGDPYKFRPGCYDPKHVHSVIASNPSMWRNPNYYTQGLSNPIFKAAYFSTNLNTYNDEKAKFMAKIGKRVEMRGSE